MKHVFKTAAALAVVLTLAPAAKADTLTNGFARIDYDRAGWEALASGFATPPVLTLSAFFDQAAANALPQSNLLADAQANPSYTNQLYVMNGPVVTNLPSRFAQPTTFAYTPGQLAQHTGVIGLGGVARFAVLGGFAGNLLFGDFTLAYDTNRFALGGSGWYVYGNIPPAAPVFDLLNVNIAEAPGTFTLSGQLGVSFEVANYLYATPEDTLRVVGTLTFTAETSASRVNAPLSNTTANGTAFLTYNRAAWATIATNAEYTDIHSVPTGIFGPTADADGQRWMFPDRLEGTNWVSAPYPAAYLTPLPDYPLVQPAGGFALPVNAYGTNRFAANHQITTYHSTTNPYGYIGLGGSLRCTSDFNEPGASVWWEHLAIAQDPLDSIWKIYATSGPGQGSIFELTNVVLETVNSNLHLSADYVFGNTDWLLFFQDVNGHLNPTSILGHIELVPASAPVTAPAVVAPAPSGSNLVLRIASGTPGSSYRVLSTTNLVAPAAVWTTNATGVLAPGGATSIAFPRDPAEPGRFYRLVQP